MKSRRLQNKRREKEKSNYKIISFVILIIMIGIILSLFIFKNTTDKKVETITINSDTTFNITDSKNNFFSLIFSLNKDNTLKNNILLYDNTTKRYFEVPIDIYVQYDEKYYLLSNIINVIKQNRSENANSNFIQFIQNLIGVKISSYLFQNTIDSKVYYSNDNKIDWQNIIMNDKDSNKLDFTKETLFDSKNIKIYNEEANDYILRKDNNKYKNIKVELYNSTNLTGLGNTYSRLLQNTGFSVVRVLNYDRIYPNSFIYNNSNAQDGEDILKQVLNSNKISNEIPSDINTVADYVIILGGDSINLY